MRGCFGCSPSSKCCSRLCLRVLPLLAEGGQTASASFGGGRRSSSVPQDTCLETAFVPSRGHDKEATQRCACGWHGDPRGRCRCTPNEVRRYQGKLSGPLLDRFDLAVEVPAVDPVDLTVGAAGESSTRVRDRVRAARALQRARFGASGPASNARMGRAELETHAPLSRGPTRLLVDACRRLGMTARAYDRVRRVARTIADLDGSDQIFDRHVAEAVQYRRVPVDPGGHLA